MTYGLRATASGNEFQIDSSLTTTKHLAVHSTGLVNASGTVVLDPEDILFIRVALASGTSAQSNSSDLQVKWTRTMSGTPSVMTAVTAHFRYAAEWLICKPSTSSSFSSHVSAGTGKTYGIQVKNASGDVCFDSRTVIKGLEILGVFGKNNFPGGHPQHSSYTYNSSGNTVFAGAANTFTLGNSAYRKIYVSCFGSEYSNSVTSGVAQSNYRFDYGGNKIFYEGFIAWGAAPGFSGAFQGPIANRSEIILGELLE